MTVKTNSCGRKLARENEPYMFHRKPYNVPAQRLARWTALAAPVITIRRNEKTFAESFAEAMPPTNAEGPFKPVALLPRVQSKVTRLAWMLEYYIALKRAEKEKANVST